MHEEYRDDILSSVMNTIADPILVVDEEGRYLEVFGGTDRSLYDDGRPLKGKMVSEILTKEFGQLVLRESGQTHDRHGYAECVRLSARHPDG